MRQDFLNYLRDYIVSIFQPCEMAPYLRAVWEQLQLQLQFLSFRNTSLCVFSLCGKWVKSFPNPVNISTTWKKFKILSFYLNMFSMALIARETAPAAASKEGFFSQRFTCKTELKLFYWLQGVTKRYRLFLLTNGALVIRVQMWWRGGSSGVSANEYSCAHHVTWSPNKLWRSNSIHSYIM